MRQRLHTATTWCLGRFPKVQPCPAKNRNVELAGMQGVRRRIIACLVLVFLVVMGVLLSHSFAAETTSPSLRIGFSSSMFTDVNENDAKAAVKVWGELIARDHNVSTDPVPIILKDIDALRRALLEKQVDGLGINTVEYASLYREVPFAPIFVTYNAGRITEKYVLLAHKDSPLKTISDLEGCTVQFQTNARACLAPMWLDTILMSQGHPAAGRFIGKIFRYSKLPDVVLPVFFRKADACVITRSGFDTMAELNPQLARQLVVLAESPDMVPSMFVFRADYTPAFKEELFAGVSDLKKTPAGRQVLTIFHSEDIEEHPISCLDTALELIAVHERLGQKEQQP